MGYFMCGEGFSGQVRPVLETEVDILPLLLYDQMKQSKLVIALFSISTILVVGFLIIVAIIPRRYHL